MINKLLNLFKPVVSEEETITPIQYQVLVDGEWITERRVKQEPWIGEERRKSLMTERQEQLCSWRNAESCKLCEDRICS